MLKAITFDLWDTLIQDDSDEPERAARGLPSKREARRRLVWQALEAQQEAPVLPYETVALAYDVMEAAFNHVWHDQHVTWRVAERLEVLLAGLGRSLPPEALAEVVRGHEEMELEVPPDPMPGIAEALAELASHYRLAVVSDAIVSPGRALRRLLEGHGLARHFSGFAFSDEVGRSKPHRAMFESAATQLGVELWEMAHVGDRDHNDVRGPQAIGMRAVLFVARRDRDRALTRADAICEHASELPAIIDRLAAGA